jgi:hypothetical protein
LDFAAHSHLLFTFSKLEQHLQQRSVCDPAHQNRMKKSQNYAGLAQEIGFGSE